MQNPIRMPCPPARPGLCSEAGYGAHPRARTFALKPDPVWGPARAPSSDFCSETGSGAYPLHTEFCLEAGSVRARACIPARPDLCKIRCPPVRPDFCFEAGSSWGGRPTGTHPHRPVFFSEAGSAAHPRAWAAVPKLDLGWSPCQEAPRPPQEAFIHVARRTFKIPPGCPVVAPGGFEIVPRGPEITWEHFVPN